MVPKLTLFTALVFATNPTHALDFADLATSACTAYLDCYGGDDREGVKVLADDDDFFDDDLYEVLGRD